MAAVSVPEGIIFMGGSFEESGESVGTTVYMYKDDKWYKTPLLTRESTEPANRRCFKCGEFGHVIANCPQLTGTL